MYIMFLGFNHWPISFHLLIPDEGPLSPTLTKREGITRLGNGIENKSTPMDFPGSNFPFCVCVVSC